MSIQTQSSSRRDINVISLSEWCAKHRPEREPLHVEEGLLQLMRTRDLNGAWTLATEMLGY